MKGNIITVDVSKGTCHYQGFLGDAGSPFRKPKVLKDTKAGFEELAALKEAIQKRSETENISVVFEATGVYHRPLQKFLDDMHWEYYIISPLLSAATRKTDIHGNKTDPLDCTSIATVYYQAVKKPLRKHEAWPEQYQKIHNLNRIYESELVHLKQRKVRFRSTLDIVYPTLDKCFKGHASLYDPVPMEILKKYPHPELLLKHKEETIVRAIVKRTNHNDKFIRDIVHRMYECAQQCYSGCEADDFEASILPDLIEELQRQEVRCGELLSELIEEAQKIPYFYQILTIPGIGENLAARLLAEIGDPTRFENKNQLIAYAGIDPKIRASGDIDGTHLHITKKGNRRLRCLLYLGASCNYRAKKDDSIRLFNQKKRQQSLPLKPKAATVAASHKLLVTIYGMCKNGTEYHF